MYIRTLPNHHKKAQQQTTYSQTLFHHVQKKSIPLCPEGMDICAAIVPVRIRPCDGLPAFYFSIPREHFELKMQAGLLTWRISQAPSRFVSDQWFFALVAQHNLSGL